MNEVIKEMSRVEVTYMDIHFCCHTQFFQHDYDGAKLVQIAVDQLSQDRILLMRLL